MQYVSVSELMEELTKYPDDLQIVLSIDEEGNGYHEGIYPEVQNGLLVLYPGGPQLDIDEVDGYIDEDED